MCSHVGGVSFLVWKTRKENEVRQEINSRKFGWISRCTHMEITVRISPSVLRELGGGLQDSVQELPVERWVRRKGRQVFVASWAVCTPPYRSLSSVSCLQFPACMKHHYLGVSSVSPVHLFWPLPSVETCSAAVPFSPVIPGFWFPPSRAFVVQRNSTHLCLSHLQ